MTPEDEEQPLYWEPTYEIVLALMERYPHCNIESVGLQELLEMILALPNFADEAIMATEQLLQDILGQWYEERNA